MSSRMNLIVVGTGVYQHWPELRLIPGHHERFRAYVMAQWTDSRVTEDAAFEPLSAPELRTRLASWLTDCKPDDDLMLVWSGHGQIGNGKHRLITFESPHPGHGTLSSENSVTTEELADYLMQCPARRIVVLLNTCWSGDGGQQLAEVIGRAVADSLSERQERSMAIISSARREESADGAFLSAALTVLRAQVPPAGLLPEYRWAASDPYLNSEQLCAAVNVLLHEHDHQAQLHLPYGIVGGFFRRMAPSAAMPELPVRVVARLFSDFSGHLPASARGWDLGQVRTAIEQSGSSEPTGELKFRLGKLALALSLLELLEQWLGSGSGLANRMPPAWASVLSPIHRTARPSDRFGYVEQVMLHAGPKQIIEFAARVIREAGDNPRDDRLYAWAQRELAVDRQVVDDALARLGAKRGQRRVIINFGMTIADDAEEDALPTSVIGWIWSPDGHSVTSPEYPFEPPYDVADMVARLVSWARSEVGDIDHIDVALPVSLFRSASRPEAARLRLRGTLTRPVVRSSGMVVRWADRIFRPDLRSDGASQAHAIAEAPDPLRWVDRGMCGQPEDLLDQLSTRSQAVGFTFEPDDLDLFYAAVYSSPYLLWTDGDGYDIGSVQREVRLRWPDVPGHLSEVYKSAEPAVIRSVRVIWDDPDWLENIVPKLFDPNRRLRI